MLTLAHWITECFNSFQQKSQTTTVTRFHRLRFFAILRAKTFHSLALPLNHDRVFSIVQIMPRVCFSPTKFVFLYAIEWQSQPMRNVCLSVRAFFPLPLANPVGVLPCHILFLILLFWIFGELCRCFELITIKAVNLRSLDKYVYIHDSFSFSWRTGWARVRVREKEHYNSYEIHTIHRPFATIFLASCKDNLNSWFYINVRCTAYSFLHSIYTDGADWRKHACMHSQHYACVKFTLKAIISFWMSYGFFQSFFLSLGFPHKHTAYFKSCSPW